MASKTKHRRERRSDPRHLAHITLSEIVGLLEAVDEGGGEMTAARVAQEVDEDLKGLSRIIDSTEFLGFLVVDEGTLRLTDLSHTILDANVRQRKTIFRHIVEELPLVQQLVERLRSTGTPLSRNVVVREIAAGSGSYQSEQLFDALVYWGRYVELFQYDGNTEQLSLRPPAKA